ncbi:MAG: amidohydrolase family protein [Oscillospiraceae bacterium]|nr:amidohydrolase family protein [Oscillospiraceae bacterium]
MPDNCIVNCPLLIDMHVHLREPGTHSYKETVASGCAAAKAGGFGAVLAMPNTSPAIDSPRLVMQVIELARNAPVRVCPAAAVTVGQKGEELTDFAALKQAGAVALSDDGMPICSERVMQCAMEQAHVAMMPLLVHCEPETEMLERDLHIAKKTGHMIHICHVSKAESVNLLRKFKRKHSPYIVTAETAPHYMLRAKGKMNPPLGCEKDIAAVIEGLCDGTIDCIATDHAPHTREEKSTENPPNGVIGLETAFSAVLEALYFTKLMRIDDIIRKMRDNPAKILGITPPRGQFSVDLDSEWVVNPARFQSMASNTPFGGHKLRGVIIQ